MRPVAMGSGPAPGSQTVRVFARDLQAPGEARLRPLGQAAGPAGGLVGCSGGVMSDLVVFCGEFARLRGAVYGFPLGLGGSPAAAEAAAKLPVAEPMEEDAGVARDWGGQPPHWVSSSSREALAAAAELWEEEEAGPPGEQVGRVVGLLLEAAMGSATGAAEEGAAHLDDVAAEAAAQCEKLKEMELSSPASPAGAAAAGLAAAVLLLRYPGGAAAFAGAGGLSHLLFLLHSATSTGALGRDPARTVRAGWALCALEVLSRSAAGLQLFVRCRVEQPGREAGRLYAYDIVLNAIERGGWHLPPAVLRAGRLLLRRTFFFDALARFRKAGRALLLEGAEPTAGALQKAKETVRAAAREVRLLLRRDLGKVLLGEDRAGARACEWEGLPRTLSFIRDQGVLDLAAGLLGVPCLGQGGALKDADGVTSATELWNEVANLLQVLLGSAAGVQLLCNSRNQVQALSTALGACAEAGFLPTDASALRAALQGLLAAEGAASALVSACEAAPATVPGALEALLKSVRALRGSELVRPPAMVLLPAVWGRLVELVQQEGPSRELSLELIYCAVREGLEDGEFLTAALPHLEAIVENLERVEGDPAQGLVPGVQGRLKSILGAVVQAQVGGPRGVQEFTGGLVKSMADKQEEAVEKGICPVGPENCAGITAGLAIITCMAADRFPERPGSEARRLPLELLDGNCPAILLDVLLCTAASLRSLQARALVRMDASFPFLEEAAGGYLRLLAVAWELSMHAFESCNKEGPEGAAPSQLNREFIRGTVDAYCATFAIPGVAAVPDGGALAGPLRLARGGALQALHLWADARWAPHPIDEILRVGEPAPGMGGEGGDGSGEEGPGEESGGTLYTAPGQFAGMLDLLSRFLPPEWPQVLELPGTQGLESRGILGEGAPRDRALAHLEPNATALATLIVQASLVDAEEVHNAFLQLCTQVASLGENGCLIMAGPVVAALQQEAAYTLAAGQDNACLAALARSMEGLALRPAPKSALLEAGVVPALLELFRPEFLPGAFSPSEGGRAHVDSAMVHALRALARLADVRVSLSPGAPLSQRTIDDSPPVDQVSRAAEVLLGASPRLAAPALGPAAEFFRSLEATPLGLAGLARGAAAWHAAEQEQPGAAGGLSDIVAHFQTKFPEMEEEEEEGKGVKVEGEGGAVEGEGTGEGSELVSARRHFGHSVLHALRAVEDAEDEVADAEELPEGASVAERFEVAARRGAERVAGSVPGGQAPWLRREQDAGPLRAGTSRVSASRMPWTCTKEETADAAERWTGQVQGLKAAAVPLPTAAGACPHWILSLHSAPAVPEDPWPQDALLAGLVPRPVDPGAPGAGAAGDQNLDLGYDDADQFQLGLEDELGGVAQSGLESAAPATAAVPQPAASAGANGASGGAAPGGGAAAPSLPPQSPSVGVAPATAAAVPAGLSPAALASIMRDPAKLKPLLEKHPELIGLLKAHMNKG